MKIRRKWVPYGGKSRYKGPEVETEQSKLDPP